MTSPTTAAAPSGTAARSCSAWTPARVFTAAIGWEIKCPQCGTFASTANTLHTCAGCGAPWRKVRGWNKYEFLCKPNAKLTGARNERQVKRRVI